MNLKRTTIVPTDDSALAKTLFNSFIEKEMMILMMVLGDTKSTRNAMQKADDLAGLSYFNMERWVIWVREPKVLESELKKYLKAAKEDVGNVALEDVKCFCFSPISDEVAGIILKNGKLSYASLQHSFFKAQSHDTPITNT